MYEKLFLNKALK